MADGFDYNAPSQIKENNLFAPRKTRSFCDISSLQNYQTNYHKNQYFNRPSVDFKQESPKLHASKDNKATFRASNMNEVDNDFWMGKRLSI